ncbi:MAG: helix-turn-helix transcriptional regulator [bacterium]|nr:helix-turn-helix transcriptional regulator [bacterium]
MVDIQKRFGDKLRVARLKVGLSQEKLATKAGLHRTYISDIERGFRNVSLKNIEKLAKAIGIPAKSLLD